MRQANALNKNATTGLKLNPEHAIPIEAKTAARKISPIYEPIIPPVSIFPLDNDLIVDTYNAVGSSTMRMIVMIAKYFPVTICHGVTGFVFRISIVPDLFSSDNVRMV